MSSRSFPTALFLAYCEAGRRCACAIPKWVLHPAAHRERHHAARGPAIDLVSLLGRVGDLACLGRPSQRRKQVWSSRLRQQYTPSRVERASTGDAYDSRVEAPELPHTYWICSTCARVRVRTNRDAPLVNM